MTSPLARSPRPLLLGALVSATEGVVLVVYGLAQLFTFTLDRAVLVLTNAVFFVVYGGALAVFSWLLATRLRSWTRAPLVLAQLIQLGVAWNVRDLGGGGPSAVLLVAALVVLVGVFHPSSLRAVEASEPREPSEAPEEVDGAERPDRPKEG